MANDDERAAGESETLDVPAGRGEMRFVPDRWDAEFEVSVVGEERLAGGGVRAADDPVVTAERAADIGLGFVNPIFDLRRERGSQIREIWR